jgi:alkylation response protein AidB-like acyl-CoA dehydrogenase
MNLAPAAVRSTWPLYTLLPIMKDVKAKHGRLDTVICNAVKDEHAPLGKITEAQFDKMVGINLKGGLFTIQSAVPLMQPGGTIILIGQRSLEDSIQYARERAQFGSPISNFQAIRFKLADMATQIEAARALLYSVREKIDEGHCCDTEAAMVKLFASEMSERVTSEGLQIHGGAGYKTHFVAERYWRDARLTKIFEGTSEIQMRIISDALLGKVAA